MKKVTDITGLINEKMWNYEEPFPKIKIRPLPEVPWVKGDVFCEIFEGLHSQTGTYLETPAHFYGNDNPCTYLLIDVPVEKTVDIPCVVLNLGMWDMQGMEERRGITVEDLETCFNAKEIREGDAILIGTGWGRYWDHPDYLRLSPYMKKEAMEWLMAKKPFLLGGDTARWENLENPEGFFPDFYAADILMLGPVVNLEAIQAGKCRLTALPLKVPETSCAPCRAIIIEE